MIAFWMELCLIGWLIGAGDMN